MMISRGHGGWVSVRQSPEPRLVRCGSRPLIKVSGGCWEGSLWWCRVQSHVIKASTQRHNTCAIFSMLVHVVLRAPSSGQVKYAVAAPVEDIRDYGWQSDYRQFTITTQSLKHST